MIYPLTMSFLYIDQFLQVVTQMIRDKKSTNFSEYWMCISLSKWTRSGPSPSPWVNDGAHWAHDLQHPQEHVGGPPPVVTTHAPHQPLVAAKYGYWWPHCIFSKGKRYTYPCKSAQDLSWMRILSMGQSLNATTLRGQKDILSISLKPIKLNDWKCKHSSSINPHSCKG